MDHSCLDDVAYSLHGRYDEQYSGSGFDREEVAGAFNILDALTRETDHVEPDNVYLEIVDEGKEGCVQTVSVTRNEETISNFHLYDV